MRDVLFAYEPYIRLAAFGGVFVVDGGLGIGRPAAETGDRTRLALAQQSRRRGGGHAAGPHSLSDHGRRSCARCRGARLGPVQRRSRCRPGSPSSGLGRHPRPRDLSPARALPCRAGAVAAAPHASCRSRIRRDHRAALPSDRNPAVDGDQARRGRGARRAGGGGADLRGAAQCHLDVQPRQRPHSARDSTACCAGSS